jgi:hypothetical protein
VKTLNTATTNSKRSRAATGRLLGVLGLFWLNLVVAPCALAFGAEHDCPHCPAEQAGEMAAHHGHHEDMAASGCDSLASDCDDLGDFAHEGRGAQLKLKDEAQPVSMAPPAIPDLPIDIVAFVTTAVDPPDPDPVFPPLHLLNCVFLD